MGEIADFMLQQRSESPSYGSPGKYRYTQSIPQTYYRKILNYLTKNIATGEGRLEHQEAVDAIRELFLKRSKIPHPRPSELSVKHLAYLKRTCFEAGIRIIGYEWLDADEELRKLKGEKNEMTIPTKEVKLAFKNSKSEEGEFQLTLTKGLLSEVVAVSFSYPHYEREGFYSERQKSVFSKDEREAKIVIDMKVVFDSLVNLLNNLLSADKLNEETYNNVMDGFEPFILEALDFSEIEPLLDTERGLKSGRKKRISKTSRKAKVKK